MKEFQETIIILSDREVERIFKTFVLGAMEKDEGEINRPIRRSEKIFGSCTFI